ncbi:DUF4294 domain-containing protein [Taibaiella soli]|uniref:DUF4294 domain-containing protein n=1 Tax=Taibaiella soli TaxID=1649169 RepID=A0A2W2BAY4_9BACT|nr:DUF4294 domain-containing protein [Taibaiella soli]PZF70796.1 hypothetical protein DN068_21365 [Taibaiella soli]
MKKAIGGIYVAISVFVCAQAKAQQSQPVQKPTDTILSVTLPVTDVYATRIMSDSMRWRYGQLIERVKKVMPYAIKVTEMYNYATATYGGPGENVKAKRRYFDEMETKLRERYKDDLKNLTDMQGLLLVRLISRQTGVTTYDLVHEYQNGFSALKWQTWGKVNGYDLKKMYDPTEDRNLEHILTNMGYPLPVWFGGVTDSL